MTEENTDIETVRQTAKNMTKLLGNIKAKKSELGCQLDEVFDLRSATLNSRKIRLENQQPKPALDWCVSWLSEALERIDNATNRENRTKTMNIHPRKDLTPHDNPIHRPTNYTKLAINMTDLDTTFANEWISHPPICVESPQPNDMLSIAIEELRKLNGEGHSKCEILAEKLERMQVLIEEITPAMSNIARNIHRTAMMNNQR